MTDSAVASLSKGAPLARTPSAEQVVERLRELIYAGSLQAGANQPTQPEIGAALQGSRPGVRDARLSLHWRRVARLAPAPRRVRAARLLLPVS